jgi:hypothetical protein
MNHRIRVCADCGATPKEAAFPGPHKPYRKPDLCTACSADPGGAAFADRVAARLAEVRLARANGRRLVPKPAHTLPLFRQQRGERAGRTKPPGESPPASGDSP